MEIASISIGTGLDLSGAMRDLKRFGSSQATASVKIKATVDDKDLTQLNKHLDLKQKHLKETVQAFKSNVIRPVVDDRALGKLNKGLDATSGKLRGINQQLRELSGLSNIQVKVSSSSQSSSQSNDKLADSIGKAVAKHSKPGIVGRAASFVGRAAGGLGNLGASVGQSLLTGVGQEVAKNFGKGLSNSIEKSISGSLGSTELVGGKLGDAMSGAIAKRVSKSLPKELQAVISDALGEENILKAGLFERSRQRSSSQRKADPIQKQAVDERRDLLRQRFEAKAQSEGISSSIRQTQSDATRREQVRDSLQGQSQREAAAGATSKRMAQFDKTIGALNAEILQLIEREQSLTDSLGDANEGLRKLDEQVKKSKSVRERVSPEAMPEFYRQAVGSVAGKAISSAQAPKLVVDDAALRRKGANALYGIESNTIQITADMDEALKAGQLTIEQMTTLFHELQHAVQFDFGSAAGIEANQQGRILNKSAKPTAAEMKAIAPLINQYAPNDRASEVDAEVVGRRQAAKAFEAQEKRRAMSALENKAGYGGVQGANVAAGQIDSVSNQLKGIRGIAQTLELDITDDIGAIAKSFSALSNGLQESVNRILGADKLSSGEVDALSEQISKQFEQLFAIQQITTKYQGKFVGRARSLQHGKTARDGGQEKIGDVKEILDRVSATSFDLNIAVGKKFGTIQTAYESLSKELNQIYETAKTNKTISTPEIQALFNGKAEEIEALEMETLKYKKQFNRRAKAVQVYRTVQGAGDTAVGAVRNTARGVGAVLDSPQGQAFLKATGQTVNALGAVAKASYQIVEGFEAVALDLIPMGRSIKAVGKQLALPAAIYAGATHMLPGGAAVAEGMSSAMGGALSPLGSAASSGMSGEVAQILKQILPDMFGMQSGAIGGASAMIEAATQAATSGAASALTAVLGGKAIQTAGSMSIKSAAGKSPFALPAAREKELLPVGQDTKAIAKVQRMEIEQDNKKLAIKAAKSAGLTVKNALDDASETIDVIAKAVSSGTAMASGGLEQAKQIGEQFSKAYSTIKSQTKEGNQAMAKAYAQNLIEMADQAMGDINKVIADLKANGADGFASDLGGTLQGIKGQIARKRNLSQKVVDKAGSTQPYIETTATAIPDEMEKRRLDLGKIKGDGADEINKKLRETEKSADLAEAAIGRIEKTSKHAFSSSIEGVNKAIQAFENGEPPIDIFKDALGSLGAVGGFVLKGLLAFSALSFLAPMLTEFATQSLAAAMEFEKFERQLNFVTGSASKTQSTLKGLSAEANALGGNFKSAIAGQAQLAAATKGTSLEGAATDQIGSAARQASAVFGLNVEEADRVNTALAQMASKGKVSAEELRQQLGEVLPGAFQIFARSIGVTSTQLDGMLQRGEVGADAMVKFASQLKSETSTGVAGAANSAQASMNRFNNEIYAMQISFGKALLPVQSFGLGALTVALQALGVILPVVAAAAIGFGTKALLGMGINAITAGVGIGALSKGLLMLPGSMLKAAVAFAPFALQAAVFVAIADAIGILGKMFGETEGASKDFATSATKGLNDYLKLTGRATDETKKLADGLNALPKSYMEEGIIGSLFKGIGGDLGTSFLRNMETDIARITTDFTPRVEKEGQDISRQSQQGREAAVEMRRMMNSELRQFSRGTGQINQVRGMDIQMRDLQAKRGMLGAGDDAGRAEIDKQYQIIIKDRENLSAVVNALPAEMKAIAEGLKASKKQIEDALAEPGRTPENIKQLQADLRRNTAEIEKGEKLLQGYAKAINTAIVGAAKLESQLQAINTASEYRSNQNALGSAQRQGAIAIAQTNGQLTPGQAQSASNLNDQTTQIQSIETLNATMLQLNNLLQDPATSRAFGISGLSSGSNSGEIGQYIADFSGDRDSEEFKILQQAQIQKAQFEQLQTQKVQASTQLAESQQQAQESIRQTTREISDFVKGIGESIAEIGRTIEAQDLDTQIQNTKNDIQRNLSGFSDRFFGDFIGGLDEMIDLINEPLRRMTEAKGTIAGMQQSLTQSTTQGNELIRNSASGGNGFVPGMGGSALGGSVAELALGREGTEFREGVAAQCANFVRDVFSQAGIELGVTNAPVDGIATSAGFANSLFGRDIGEIITDPLKLVAGDIVGFRNTYKGDWGADAITHTGIYTGNGMMIDRSTSSAPVRHRPLDTFDMTGFVAVRPNAFAAAGGNVGNASTPPATSMSASSAAIGAGNYGGVSLNEEQVRNAAIIAKVGRDLGVSPRDIQIAIATAMQESSLVNLTGGHLDSVGLFQQRPSMDWGTNDQIMNPEHSARSFFQGAGTNPGLLDIQDRGSMSVAQAAQATQRSAHPDAYAKWEGMSAALAGKLGSGGAGGTAINTPGANTSAIDPALTQYGAAIAQQTDSIMSRMEAQNEGSTIALRQKMQASRQKLEEAQRTLIDETRQYNERYQDSILAAFGDSPIASALQQLTTDSRDVESTTRAMSLTINDATNSLDNLKATRQTILDDPSLAPLKELVPGMDAAIAQYESQIDQIGVARDREQRILSDRRNAIIENLEATGREQLKVLSQQTEDLQIQQQAGLVKDPQLAAMLQGRSQRMELVRSFESESGAIVSEIAKISGGIERLKSEALAAGSVIDPLQLEVATGQLDNLKDRLDALYVNRDLKLQLIDAEQIELLRQFNQESEQALLSAQVESLNNQGDVFGANRLQFLAARNQLNDEYKIKLDSINQLEMQMGGQAGASADRFAKMRTDLDAINDTNLDNLRQQFPDLATAVNDVAKNAFLGLSGSISNVIKGTGTLEDVFDSFASSVIDGLVDMAVKWAASKLFKTLAGGGGGGDDGGGGGGGGTDIISVITQGISGLGFDNGGMIPGRFSGMPDQHVARVNPGEYIMQRSSVQKYGSATMRSINMGSFDKGGMVGSDRATYKDYSSKSESGGSREPIKVEYEVTRINEQNFVTEEQLRRSLTATSEQTEKRINRSMRSSPSYRAGIGI